MKKGGWKVDTKEYTRGTPTTSVLAIYGRSKKQRNPHNKCTAVYGRSVNKGTPTTSVLQSMGGV